VIYGEEFVNKFIFDVDGTLTPSRGKINKEFEQWFLDFCLNQDVYLVTGSDHPKTVEQVGEAIVNACKRVYNCSGSDVYEKGKNIRTNSWSMPKEQMNWLEDRLEESAFNLRTGNHIEQRPGMVNFSIVGRNANLEERARYVAYDKFENERKLIADLFEQRFPHMQATVGGETGIDIAPLGADKSQILADFNKNDRILFFGDAMEEGGNDYPLAVALTNGGSFGVNGWQETWKHLQDKNIYKGSV
jgi:phosphomannomutase